MLPLYYLKFQIITDIMDKYVWGVYAAIVILCILLIVIMQFAVEASEKEDDKK